MTVRNKLKIINKSPRNVSSKILYDFSYSWFNSSGVKDDSCENVDGYYCDGNDIENTDEYFREKLRRHLQEGRLASVQVGACWRRNTW